METIRRRGWLYQIERDQKGRIKKFKPLRVLLPIESINLLSKTEGETRIKETELIGLFREWLRENVPSIKQDKIRWYIIRRVNTL